MMSCLYFTKNSIIFPNLSTEVQVKENCSTEQFSVSKKLTIFDFICFFQKDYIFYIMIVNLLNDIVINNTTCENLTCYSIKETIYYGKH